MRQRALALVLLLIPSLLAGNLPARATFAGTNGRILFTRFLAQGNGEIFTMRNDGTEVVRLTNNLVNDIEGAWSPDGSTIAFSSNRDGDYEIFLMASDGSGVVQLTSNSTSDRQPSWSPDGRAIVFATDREDPEYREILYVMDSSGGNQHSIGIEGFQPTWSPDGSRIAYVGLGCSDNIFWNIFTTTPTGASVTQITNCEDGSEWLEPDWSPDGTKLAVTAHPGDDDVAVVAADGSGLLGYIADGYDLESSPSWSPDGSRIAYSSGGITSVSATSGSDAKVLTSSSDDYIDWGRCPAGSACGDATGPGIGSASASPNRFSPDGDGTKDVTNIRFTLNEDATVVVHIRDSSGETVFSSDRQVIRSGAYSFRWDGFDQGGRNVPSGTYTFVIEASDASGNVRTATGTVVVEYTMLISQDRFGPIIFGRSDLSVARQLLGSPTDSTAFRGCISGRKLSWGAAVKMIAHKSGGTLRVLAASANRRFIRNAEGLLVKVRTAKDLSVGDSRSRLTSLYPRAKREAGGGSVLYRLAGSVYQGGFLYASINKAGKVSQLFNHYLC